MGAFHRNHLPEVSLAAPVLRRDGQSRTLEHANLEKEDPGILCERTAISRKPEELARQELEALQEEDRMTPDLVFRNPYLLDFLGLEAAILRELERFLLELGTDFSFIARKKCMTIGDRDFYLDLLFYHRSLRRLVAIELKLGSFDAAYKGQMVLYLRCQDKYERRPGRILANVPGSF